MEIWSYLWSRRWRIAVLVLLPVLTGIATAYYVSSTAEPQVEGALELTLPTAASAGSTDAQMANFIAAAQGESVRRRLSEDFDLRASDIKANLKVTRVDSDGTYIRIQYTGDTTRDLSAIVTSVAGQALSALLDPQIAAQTASRNEILAQFATIGDDPNFQTPKIPLGLTEKQLVQRKQALLLDQIASLNQQISQLTAQRSAVEAVAADQKAVTTSTISKDSLVLKATVVNAGVALFVAIVLIVAWDTVRPRRSTRTAHKRAQPTRLTA